MVSHLGFLLLKEVECAILAPQSKMLKVPLLTIWPLGIRHSSVQSARKSEKVDGGTLFGSGKDDVENMLCLVQNCRGFELERINVVGEI